MSQNGSSDRPSARPKPATTIQREQRLAVALRENLKRRKAQARDQARDQERDQALDRTEAGEKPRQEAGDKSDRA